MTRAPVTPSREDLDGAVAGTGLRAVFQPIVSLPGGRVVGYEALARWPHLAGVPREDVFTYAVRTGRAALLERHCIEAAIGGARAAGLAPGSTLFINCEATAPFLSRSDSDVLARGAERFRIVFEVTERSLLAHPPDLLRKVVALREEGFAIALDDVGADMNALALLDVLAPDVIKLDMSLVQSRPHYEQARTWAAVLAHHERAGARVLAEGIETVEHLDRALALGATLGQGYRFGHPAQLASDATAEAPSPPIRTQHPCVDFGSPFDTVASHQSTPGDSAPIAIHRHDKATVVALSRYLEQQALQASDPPMVLTALQEAKYFTGETRTRYERLAMRSPLVAVFGRDVADHLGSGIHGVRFDRDDSLQDQWIVLALGANIATALVSREVPSHNGAGDRGEQSFDVTSINDRTLVTGVARQLLSRMLTPAHPNHRRLVN
ncbi:sensor domain-containing phosphodiesterase [Mycolicibacterium lacusdiani]|uniref:sensor domain-containing phosphodiesterase n=1 Tax=Mycolicibacterium lacusdiani TaxID=2895283 RepID=UPI001F44A150|nr:EAL domain-containing protein [Mycolicibacterium lacusdiani]